MTTKLIFNKPDGFITVTDRSRKWIISKEEANSVFVSIDETQTLMGGIGSLFAAFLTLVPVEQRKKIRYEVKIVTTSGEQVRLFRNRNAELAEDMVKRIVSFSTQSEVTEDTVNTQMVDKVEERKIYAGFWRRLAAFVIDYFVMCAALPVIGLMVDASTGVEMGQGAIIILPPLHFMYCLGFWTWRGQTPGKIATGIKIMKSDGSSLGIGRALLRYLGYIVSALTFCVIGFFAIAWDSRKQGLHDMIASTYVVKTS
ncbi:RDD family protein [Chloroflexota bacterium]